MTHDAPPTMTMKEIKALPYFKQADRMFYLEDEGVVPLGISVAEIRLLLESTNGGQSDFLDGVFTSTSKAGLRVIPIAKESIMCITPHDGVSKCRPLDRLQKLYAVAHKKTADILQFSVFNVDRHGRRSPSYEPSTFEIESNAKWPLPTPSQAILPLIERGWLKLQGTSQERFTQEFLDSNDAILSAYAKEFVLARGAIAKKEGENAAASAAATADPHVSKRGRASKKEAAVATAAKKQKAKTPKRKKADTESDSAASKAKTPKLEKKEEEETVKEEDVNESESEPAPMDVVDEEEKKDDEDKDASSDSDSDSGHDSEKHDDDGDDKKSEKQEEESEVEDAKSDSEEDGKKEEPEEGEVKAHKPEPSDDDGDEEDNEL